MILLDDDDIIADELCACLRVLVSALLSVSEFWYDRFFGSDDLEGTDGCNRK